MLTAIWVALLLLGGAALAWWGSGPVRDRLDPTTPGRAFTIAHLLLIGLGSVVLAASRESAGGGPLLAGYGLLAFGAGAAVGRLGWGAPTSLSGSMTVGPLRPPIVALFGVAALAGLVGVALQSGVPFLSENVQESRAGLEGLPFNLFRWLLPPTALVALGIALARPSGRTWLLAGVMLGGALLLMLLLASRALPFELAIAALLLSWWAGRRLPRRAWLAIAAVGLILFVGVQLARSRGSFSGVADVALFSAERTVNRIVLIQPRILDLLVTNIPSREPYWGGATYARTLVHATAGETPRSLGYWIYDRLFPARPGGFATPGLVGELWANGGPVVLPGMFLVGFAFQALGRFLARLSNTVADRVFAALLVVAAARAYALSLNGFLVLVVVLLAWRLAVTVPSLPDWLPLPRRFLGRQLASSR